MARIRTIKPDFFTDEKLAECSRDARLLFIGLIVHVDDYGYMLYSPKRIRLMVFPGDNGLELEPMFDELLINRIIEIFEQEGQKYLWIRNFNRHQVIHNMGARSIRYKDDNYNPPPERQRKRNHVQHRNVPTGTPDVSVPVTTSSDASRREGQEVEVEVEVEKELNTKSKSKPRCASRIPEDFVPNEEHYQLGKELGVIVDMEFQTFRDHFLGVSGRHGLKLDWNATFRKWLRNSVNYRRGNGQASKAAERNHSNQQSLVAALERRYGGTNAQPSGNSDGVQGVNSGGERPMARAARALSGKTD